MFTATQITADHQSYGERRAEERARVMPIRAERRIRVGDMLVAHRLGIPSGWLAGEESAQPAGALA